MTITEGSICSSYFNSVITLVSTSDESFCDKVSSIQGFIVRRGGVITELKYDEHIEPPVSDKGSSYFNIVECGRNLLDQLDVTYKRAFMATPVPEGHYMSSTAQERYYDTLAKILINRTSEVTELYTMISLTISIE